MYGDVMVTEVKCELNEEGYLPQRRFNVTLEEFKKLFVFIRIEKKRKKLFTKYESFCKRFESIILRLWVNGSYTTKKLNPSDIDVAVFYDALKFDDLSQVNINEKRIFNDHKYIHNKYALHLLPVPVYPKDHDNYIITKLQSEKWDKLFLKDTRQNPPVIKGYVEIIQVKD